MCAHCCPASSRGTSQQLRAAISHLDADRALPPDIEAAAALVREGALIDL
jgi:histidine ammonia-lyase